MDKHGPIGPWGNSIGDTNGDAHHDGAYVIDIDSDGDENILLNGWGHNRVLLYENLSTTLRINQ